MIIIKGLKEFGIWCKPNKYHLVSNELGNAVIKDGYAKKIMTLHKDAIITMIADFKINGMPKEVVKYFVDNKLSAFNGDK